MTHVAHADTCFVDVNDQRISRQNLQALKAHDTSKERLWVRINAFAQSAFRQLPGVLGFLLPKAKVNSCEFNGHVMRQRRFNGVHRVCDDCGCELDDNSVMRVTDITMLGLTSVKGRQKFWYDESLCA